MNKLSIFAMILLLILAVFITFLLANSNNSLDYYTHTKAICNETNYCQDYQIFCNKDKLIMTTPITGAVVQYSVSWQDPRNELEKELC